MKRGSWAHLWALLFLLILSSCSSSRQSQQLEYKNLLKLAQYDKAWELLKAPTWFDAEDGAFLLALERGMVLHLKGHFFHSSQYFAEAKKTYDSLYRAKVSKVIQGALAGEEYQDYTGDLYELSLMHFVQAMNFYQLSLLGQKESHTPLGAEGALPAQALSPSERRQFLLSARAEIMAWDRFWKTQRVDEKVKTFYRHDLMAKLFGGMIHEISGVKFDRQISLQLYKDALNLLETQYGIYPSFNQTVDAFQKNPQRSHIKPTPAYSELEFFIKKKISALTLAVRSWDLKKASQTYGLRPEHLKAAREEGEASLFVVVNSGLISPKVAQPYNIGLKGLAEQSKDSTVAQVMSTVGLAALSYFASKELGLSTKQEHWASPRNQLGYRVGGLVATGLAVDFALPKIAPPPRPLQLDLLVEQEGSPVLQERIPLINPMGEMAQEVVAERSTVDYLKVGTKVGLKYLAAIALAYATYKGLEKKDSEQKGSLLAKLSALATFYATKKLIDRSNRPDLRHWISLPQHIYFTQLSLPAGSYQTKLQCRFEGQDVAQFLGGPITLSKERPSPLTFHLPQLVF